MEKLVSYFFRLCWDLNLRREVLMCVRLYARLPIVSLVIVGDRDCLISICNLPLALAQVSSNSAN